MASPNGYTQSIRTGLSQKGVNPNSIGYNPATNYVTVDGKDAIKSGKNYMGTNYATQYGFNNDWAAYQKSLQQPQQQPTVQQAPVGQQPQANTAQSYGANQYDPKMAAGIEMLANLMNQAPVDANSIYGSPQWAAYQAQAQRGAQQATRAAQESLGASGFGRSTALAERSQGIQNDANEYMSTQVLPQLMSQAQAEQQQKLQNQVLMLNQLANQQGVHDTRFNNERDFRLQEGQTTGNYMNSEAESALKNLLSYKTQTEQNWQTMTPEQRAAAATKGDELRNIARMAGAQNVDQLFGSDVKAANAAANYSKAGQRTIGGINQDLASQNQKFNQDITMAEVTGFLPDGTPTSKQEAIELSNLWDVAEQTGKIPDALAQLYGIPKGSPTRAAFEFAKQLAISQQNANTSARSQTLQEIDQEDDSARQWAELDYEMNNPESTESKYEGLPANQILSSIKDNYTEAVKDASGYATDEKSITTNPARREQMFLDVVDSGLNDTETTQMLKMLGLTKAEIDKYTKQYSGN